MSIWEKHDLGNKILDILNDVKSHNEDHHFGVPFSTSYQIAIMFKERYPDIFIDINMPLGGKITKQHTSLSQYFARELSRHVKNKTMPIEGTFLYRKSLETLSYNTDDEHLASSLGDSSDLSMFRILQDS